MSLALGRQFRQRFINRCIIILLGVHLNVGMSSGFSMTIIAAALELKLLEFPDFKDFRVVFYFFNDCSLSFFFSLKPVSCMILATKSVSGFDEFFYFCSFPLSFSFFFFSIVFAMSISPRTFSAVVPANKLFRWKLQRAFS